MIDKLRRIDLNQFFKKHPVIISGIILAIILVLVLSTRKKTRITGVEGAVGTVVMPVESGVSSFTRGVGSWFRMVLGISDVQRENATMKQKIEQMESDLALLNEVQQENKRLSEIAQYIQDNQDYEFITAAVTGKNPGYWFDNFVINAGYRQGIDVGMTVITPQGLVGRVTEVSGSWSKVTSIISNDSSVSALVERTRDNTIVRGNTLIDPTNELCTMEYLPLDNDLLPGDVIKTSGLGDSPKGIIIGEVQEVARGAEDVERTAVITPSVDFMKLEEVMVIIEEKTQVQP